MTMCILIEFCQLLSPFTAFSRELSTAEQQSLLRILSSVLLRGGRGIRRLLQQTDSTTQAFLHYFFFPKDNGNEFYRFRLCLSTYALSVPYAHPAITIEVKHTTLRSSLFFSVDLCHMISDIDAHIVVEEKERNHSYLSCESVKFKSVLCP